MPYCDSSLVTTFSPAALSVCMPSSVASFRKTTTCLPVWNGCGVEAPPAGMDCASAPPERFGLLMMHLLPPAPVGVRLKLKRKSFSVRGDLSRARARDSGRERLRDVERLRGRRHQNLLCRAVVGRVRARGLSGRGLKQLLVHLVRQHARAPYAHQHRAYE